MAKHTAGPLVKTECRIAYCWREDPRGGIKGIDSVRCERLQHGEVIDSREINVPNLVAAARELVMRSTPYASTLEMDSHGEDDDGEKWHAAILEALGISREEWQAEKEG